MAEHTWLYDDQPVLKMTRKKQGLCHQNIPPSHFFLKKEIKINSWSRGQSQSSGWQHFPPLKGQSGNQTRHHGVVKDVSLLANAGATAHLRFQREKRTPAPSVQQQKSQFISQSLNDRVN